MARRKSYEIEIFNPQTYRWADKKLLRRVLALALRRFEIKTATLSLVIVNDDHMTELHQRYLGLRCPTDVLSFDLGDSKTPNRSPKSTLDGEVIVSADTAWRVARSRQHRPSAELALYAVHGTLHLLGLDDADEKQAAAMHRIEDEILTTVGVGPVYH